MNSHVFIYLPLSGPIKVTIHRDDGSISSAMFPVGEHATTGDKDYISGMIRALKFANRNAATETRTMEIRSETR